MNNEDFFDILGDLDNDIISDAAFIKNRKKHSALIKIITVSAAVFAFILVGILIKNSFMNTDYSLPTQETVSDNEALPTEAVTDEISTEDNTITSTGENTSEITSPSEPPSQGEEPSSDFSEPSTDDDPDIIGTPLGIPIKFIDTDILNLISVGVDSNGYEYPISEKTDIFTLQDIYGTKIIPSYLPTVGTTINSTEKKYTVYYSKDRTEVYCKNYFTYLLEGGNILTITASTEEIPMLDTEKENISAVSYISESPVLLFRGTENGFVPLYSAYFQKDGCYFRIQLNGISPDKEEFVKIITSVIC